MITLSEGRLMCRGVLRAPETELNRLLVGETTYVGRIRGDASRAHIHAATAARE